MALEKKYVLLVDDDTIIDYLHKKILKKAGINDPIITVFNGQEAIDQLFTFNNIMEEKDSVLILLDLNMPILNGWQFLEEFKTLQHELKYQTAIYILSSSINPDDIQMAENNKLVKGYLKKPLTLETVNTFLKMKHLAIENIVFKTDS